jgi:hypothetical protein
MPCALTKGYALDCRDSVGGVKQVAIALFDNVTGVSANATGEVTGIGMSATTKFYRYQLPKNVGSAIETLTSSAENGTTFFAQEVKIALNKLSADVRRELALLCVGRLMVAVQDQNNTWWLHGKTNSLEATAGTFQTGVNFGDRNGYDITMTGMEGASARPILLSAFTGVTAA